MILVKLLVWLFLLLSIFVSGCSQFNNDGLISAELILSPSSHFSRQTLTPDIPLQFESFTIRGVGPAETTFDLSSGEARCTVEGILPGEWSIVAEGFNSGGYLLADGASTIEFSNEVRSAEIQLLPLTGTGTLAIDFSWDAGLVQEPVFTAGALDSENVPAELEIALSAGFASITATLENGLYILNSMLYDGETAAAGMADIIAILPDQNTVGSIYLDIALNPIGAEIMIDTPRIEPYGIAINGYEPPVFVGESISLSYSVEDDGFDAGELAAQWYIDGSLAGVEQIFSLQTGAAAMSRVDLLVMADGWTSGGSASKSIWVYEPIYYGSLIYISSIFDNTEGTDGLSGVRSLALNTSSDFLYSAGYDEAEIGIFSLSENTGKPAFEAVVGNSDTHTPNALDGISDIAISSDGAYLWTVSSGGGSMVAFGVDPATGLLIGLQTLVPASEDFQALPEDIEPGVNPLTGAQSLVASSDDRFLYVCSPQTNTIAVFAFDTGTGIITPYSLISPAVLNDQGGAGELLAGPEGTSISPGGDWLVVACKNSDSILLFSVDLQTGALSFNQAFSDEVDGVDGINAPFGTAWSPDGLHLYVTGYYDDAVNLFAFSSDIWNHQGTWKDEDYPQSPYHYPRGLAVSPDGAEVYVCASGSDGLTVFGRDVVSGQLSDPVSAVNGEDRLIGLDGLRDVVISDNGAFLYAGAANDGAVVFFRR